MLTGTSLLQYPDLPQPQGTVRLLHQLLLKLPRKRLDACGFNSLKRHPVHSWGTVVGLRQPIDSAQRLHVADMDVKSPNAPCWFSLRLDV
jgi:hypothetical protein